ncbi:hypothetical protein D9756_007681 [Leucocoprinus leucothites]|uniref:F-box domain-containing protein n=1 Tax=Leucocoprinus leucothites TaxID=201217 RepID=A0A8H5D372_9AGAR|nr:hypothetical protein D9756_007681 [Leucoagaricus leucothites]
MKNRAEIHFIDTTLRRLDLEIQQTELLRSRLRRRLNELNASTATTPPEILSRIFEIASAVDLSGIGEHIPLKLAAVCSQWRDIIHSTPTLWQSLSVHLHDEQGALSENIRLVECHTQRIGSLPLNLRVEYEGNANLSSFYDDLGKVPSLTFFEQVFEISSDKLGTLVLKNIPQTWWPLLSLNSSRSAPYPSLKHVALTWPEEGTNGKTVSLFQNNSALQLTHVSLTGHQLPVELPWRQLTFLNLHNLLINHCFDLLIACPGLVEFHCKTPTHSANGTAESIARQISQIGTFPRMERMSWDFGLYDWDTILLDNARFPSLQWMSWKRYISGEFIAFLEGLSLNQLSCNKFVSSLQALTGFRCSLHLWTIEDLCSVLPSSLQELYLIGDNLEARLPACFDALTLHIDGGGSSGCLPYLRALGLPDLHYCADPSTLMSSLLKMLRSRRPLTASTPGVPPGSNVTFLGRLYFSIATPEDTKWDKNQLDLFQEYIRGGLALEAGNGRKQNHFCSSDTTHL